MFIEEKAATVHGPAETRPMTLADAAINALDAQDPDDKAGNSSTNKLNKYRLMQKIINGSGPIDATEAALITTQVAKFYPPSIYGQVNDMLAPQAPES